MIFIQKAYFCKNIANNAVMSNILLLLQKHKKMNTSELGYFGCILYEQITFTQQIYLP